MMVSDKSLDTAYPKKLAIVIPCFNEAERLNLAAYALFIRCHSNITFCFVDDGSTDATLSLLTEFVANHPADASRVISLSKNEGKAEAVRQGMLAMLEESLNPNDLIGFWDADLATPLAELDRFVQAFSQNHAMQVVVGFRKKDTDAHIERSFTRKIISRIMHTIIAHYIGLPIHDTQCGAKLFKASIASAIFAAPFIARWLFDIEIFFRVKHFLGPDALEQNVEQLHLKAWHDVPGTKLCLRDVPKIFLELINIKTHYHGW